MSDVWMRMWCLPLPRNIVAIAQDEPTTLSARSLQFFEGGEALLVSYLAHGIVYVDLSISCAAVLIALTMLGAGI